MPYPNWAVVPEFLATGGAREPTVYPFNIVDEPVLGFFFFIAKTFALALRCFREVRETHREDAET